MIYKINNVIYPLDVYDWFLVRLRSDENNNWCVKRYIENGLKVKELIIL